MDLKIQFAQALVVAAIIALSASFVGATSEQSAPSTQPGQPTTPIPDIPAPNADFIKLDRDKNGALSKSEASRNKDLTKRWDALDANKDSKLDPGEFAQFEVSPPADSTKKPSENQNENQKSPEPLKTTPPVM